MDNTIQTNNITVSNFFFFFYKTKLILNTETNNHISIQIPNLNTQKLIYDPQHKKR